LAELTPYFFIVLVTDVAGNTTTDDNGGACYSFTTLEHNEHFTELFDSRDNDLSYGAVMLTPDGSVDFYTSCRIPTAAFPTRPKGGTYISLSDNDYESVTLTGGAEVSLYGTPYSSFYVGSNGYLTFTGGDSYYWERLDYHFQMPRVSGLFDDLRPPSGGVVSWKQRADRVAVTFDGVYERYGAANSFQIELFFDGRIRITHLSVGATDGLVGLSEGLDLPVDFVESDVSAYLSCACGNGSLDSGEACDDGNVAPCDGCSDLCQPEGVCGDGVLDANCEECDDGNLIDGDGCESDCTLSSPPFRLISGHRIVLRDKEDQPQRRRFNVFSKDFTIEAPEPGSACDPTVHGAELRLVNPGTTEDHRIPLPAGSWKAAPRMAGGGYTYRDRLLGNGPCKRVRIRSGKALRAVCIREEMPFTLNEDSQGSLTVVLQLGTDPTCGSCMSFGGTVKDDFGTEAWRRRASRGVGRFRALEAPAPTSCPLP
jgi:cysteine-rich repeat protein